MPSFSSKLVAPTYIIYKILNITRYKAGNSDVDVNVLPMK